LVKVEDFNLNKAAISDLFFPCFDYADWLPKCNTNIYAVHYAIIQFYNVSEIELISQIKLICDLFTKDMGVLIIQKFEPVSELLKFLHFLFILIDL